MVRKRGPDIKAARQALERQRSEIEEQHPSPVSMMPTGSLDTLNRDEILDLIAYLRSGGNPSHEMFSEQTR